MSIATGPDEAKNAFATPLAFMPSNGGLGIRLSATTTSGTSSRTALVGSGNTLRIYNGGIVSASLALGSSSVEATTSHMEIGPGATEMFSIPAGREFTEPTHAAVITATGSTTIQITRGFGV